MTDFNSDLDISLTCRSWIFVLLMNSGRVHNALADSLLSGEMVEDIIGVSAQYMDKLEGLPEFAKSWVVHVLELVNVRD
jgi:hypothetical protein